MSANTAAAYQTVEDIVALYVLSKLKAEQLLTKTEVVINHGKSEPEGITEWEDQQIWVEQGYEKLVSSQTM